MGRYKNRDHKAKHGQRQLGIAEEPVHWIVPVFGIAAATAIALYTRYLEEAKVGSKIIGGSLKKMQSQKIEEKLMDALPRTTRTTLVKSRSAFV